MLSLTLFITSTYHFRLVGSQEVAYFTIIFILLAYFNFKKNFSLHMKYVNSIEYKQCLCLAVIQCEQLITLR